jgi:hypothetical protein
MRHTPEQFDKAKIRITADIAEFAVKVGCSFDRATQIFFRFGYCTIREVITRGSRLPS